MESIGSYAFESSNLKNVTLPSSLLTIGSNAFRGAKKLVNITLPDTLEEIQNSAFTMCSSLKYIEIPMSVTKFGSSVFSMCSKDLVVNFLNKTRFMIKNGMVFKDGSVLVEYFGDEGSDVVVPSVCNSIPSNIFATKNISSVTFEDVSRMSLGVESFASSAIKSIELPSCINYIGEKCFYNCKYLTAISFKDAQITTIPKQCFALCTSLTSLSLASSKIATIGESAFKESGLTQVDFEESIIKTISPYAFANTKITKAILPATIESIGVYAFSSCLQLHTVSMQNCDSLLLVEKYVFSYCSLLNNVSLGYNTEKLSENCFRECIGLTFLTLAPKTEYLEIYCLYKCIQLRTIKIPASSLLKRIYPYALDKCISLTSFDVTESNRFSFADGTLMNIERTNLIFYLPTTKKSSLIISGNVQAISEYAFQSCNNLKEVIVSDGNLTSIGYQAFKDCINLRRLVLPISLKTVDEDAFSGCSKLKCGCVSVPESIKDVVISKGKIPSSVLSDVCVQKECIINFGVITCKGRGYHSTNVMSLALYVMLVSY